MVSGHKTAWGWPGRALAELTNDQIARVDGIRLADVSL